jgi:hypothetical protein
VAEVKTYRRQAAESHDVFEVTAVLVESFDDVRDLRAAEAWHEGAVALLSFPSSPPVAFVSLDNPKYFGKAVGLGQAVVKGPAGDFGVVPIPGLLEKYSEVAS